MLKTDRQVGKPSQRVTFRLTKTLRLAHRQRGAVAAETALITIFILLPLFALLFFGRYFRYYTAAQKAVHDATLDLASTPLADVRSNNAATVRQADGLIILAGATMRYVGR